MELQVMILDDEYIILDGLCSFPWSDYGYRISATARNGLEGLEKLDQAKPDLILTDVKMPGMDGLDFAEKAHEGQFRKGTKRPYIVHPLEVAKIVSTMTDDEEIISAALLHDTLEDCRQVTKEQIKEAFGERVLEMVRQESEDKSKTWVERKSTTIRHLKTAPRAVQMIALADKLSNIRDIDREYPKVGEEFWNRFRMKSKAAMGWYYIGVKDALQEDFAGIPAYEEYKMLVDKIFGSTSDWQRREQNEEDKDHMFCE